jgi:hypothetical protein
VKQGLGLALKLRAHGLEAPTAESSSSSPLFFFVRLLVSRAVIIVLPIDLCLLPAYCGGVKGSCFLGRVFGALIKQTQAIASLLQLGNCRCCTELCKEGEMGKRKQRAKLQGEKLVVHRTICDGCVLVLMSLRS